VAVSRNLRQRNNARDSTTTFSLANIQRFKREKHTTVLHECVQQCTLLYRQRI
jgi:hypothetical protein